MTLQPFLPGRADNAYRGHKLALAILAVVVLLKLVIGLNSIFNGRSVATSADGIPLDTFTPAGARTAVSLFSLLGLSHVVFGLLCVLVLVRYRALVPLMFGLLLLDHLGKRLILHFLPIPRTGSPPGSAINLILLALLITGLTLSIVGRGGLSARERGSP